MSRVKQQVCLHAVTADNTTLLAFAAERRAGAAIDRYLLLAGPQ